VGVFIGGKPDLETTYLEKIRELRHWFGVTIIHPSNLII
jgi:hypothetical protein